MLKTKLTATDLFSGAGGSSAGLELAGYRVEACANHWPTAVSTHAQNHPEAEHFTANLSEVDFRTFPRTDLLWASPSCVWHARSGGRKSPPAEVERLRMDEGSVDRATAFAVIAAAEVHRYEAVIVENVPEFTAWSLFDWWVSGMEALGYLFQQTTINAYDVGEAQSRVRWFGVFTRGETVDLSLPQVERRNADQILEPGPWKRVLKRMYISDQIAQIDALDTPHLVTYRKNARARRADLHPVATVTAGAIHHYAAKIDRQYRQHYRRLTVRELARAQGFPDHYEFMGTQADVVRQIGNAVSVRVARFLGERVADSIGAGSSGVAA